MVELSDTRCSCFAILWVSLVSFAAILCVASQRVFIVVVVYFVIDSVRKISDTPSYMTFVWDTVFTHALLSVYYLVPVARPIKSLIIGAKFDVGVGSGIGFDSVLQKMYSFLLYSETYLTKNIPWFRSVCVGKDVFNQAFSFCNSFRPHPSLRGKY
jgi:hypothetical protein